MFIDKFVIESHEPSCSQSMVMECYQCILDTVFPSIQYQQHDCCIQFVYDGKLRNVFEEEIVSLDIDLRKCTVRIVMKSPYNVRKHSIVLDGNGDIGFFHNVSSALYKYLPQYKYSIEKKFNGFVISGRKFRKSLEFEDLIRIMFTTTDESCVNLAISFHNNGVSSRVSKKLYRE